MEKMNEQIKSLSLYKVVFSESISDSESEIFWSLAAAIKEYDEACEEDDLIVRLYELKPFENGGFRTLRLLRSNL